MAQHYGENVAKNVEQTRVTVVSTAWAPLVARSGENPLPHRTHLRIQVKAAVGASVALEYANGVISTNPTTRQQQVTFTAPTAPAGNSFIVAGNSAHVEPLGDNVQVYGRLVNKKGSTAGSASVIVTEYA